MGGSYSGSPKAPPRASELITHPNFSVPPLPKDVHVKPETFNKIVEWALEAASNFVSPKPKEDDEDQSFECEDVAAEIKDTLAKVLKVK